VVRGEALDRLGRSPTIPDANEIAAVPSDVARLLPGQLPHDQPECRQYFEWAHESSELIRAHVDVERRARERGGHGRVLLHLVRHAEPEAFMEVLHAFFGEGPVAADNLLDRARVEGVGRAARPRGETGDRTIRPTLRDGKIVRIARIGIDHQAGDVSSLVCGREVADVAVVDPRPHRGRAGGRRYARDELIEFHPLGKLGILIRIPGQPTRRLGLDDTAVTRLPQRVGRPLDADPVSKESHQPSGCTNSTGAPSTSMKETRTSPNTSNGSAITVRPTIASSSEATR
jgi:hypothetical protein